jgi:hypothetical protein
MSGSLSTDATPVWKIDALVCADGDRLIVTFESADERWAHGVWFGVDGQLAVADSESPQVVLWKHSTPSPTELRVVASTDGLLRLYNVWESGRGRGREGQSHTSGMVREDVPGGWRYRCNDIGTDPDFTALVFTVTRP